MMNEKNIVPCTGCDYCADCPKGIKISTVFAYYNQFKNDECSKEESIKKYNTIPVENNAFACIKCGKCASHCPQSIEIPSLLHGEVGQFFAE